VLPFFQGARKVARVKVRERQVIGPRIVRGELFDERGELV
jgi:hypothetical protein